MKFSREYEASIVPEWKAAFVDYKRLKKLVKKIKVARRDEDGTSSDADALVAGFSVRGLAARFAPKVQASPDDEESSDSSGELLRLDEREFLETAGEELDKVSSFYATKEAELLARGDALIHQLRILADVKRILADHAASRRGRPSRTRFMPATAPLPPAISGSGRFLLSASGLASPQSMSDGSVELHQAQIIEGATMADEVMAALEGNGVSFVGKKGGSWGRGAGPLQMPASVRIDIPATNPGRTALKVWEELVNVLRKDVADPFVHRKKIQHAEKNIRDAFMALHRGLELLKKFSSLNVKAFTKILKKFVKVSEQQRATDLFSEKVKGSSFSTSDKALQLADEVESLFMKHFAGNDRMVAMKYLKPQQPRSTHMITFLVGLFTGTFVSLFIIYAISAHLSGIFSSPGNTAYLGVVYHIFSMFALISLHCFLYGCNLFMWKNTRINQNFIFDFAPNTTLTHRDAFLMSASIMCTVVATLVINLFLRNVGASYAKVVPGTLIVVSMGVLVCPFNVFYRSTRYYFMRVMRNIVFSPFYKVLMADFFMADQLTSQIPLLRHMEFTACYFMAGSFTANPYETCTNSQEYKHVAYVISFLPYYWRAMQCLRRYLEEHDTNQLANAAKYMSAMVAAVIRFKYSATPTSFWALMVIISSSGATLYQLYWDFVKDWGFFTRKSKNRWLRDELILKNKSVYYVSMVLHFPQLIYSTISIQDRSTYSFTMQVLNLVLRLGWTVSVMEISVSINQTRLLYFSLASLEIIRRGHWNFYRLENEHLNNVGKFRAVKSVPLPFRELETD
ncbi:phosphate transporter PHO1-2-like isoform X2 [Lolium rigidum]|uniref:phosphate transporter PHO1-2-like isoform X2 n=1 Tax=Lolium rigidum TaxID=89674 RepID=UPI001F5C5092|nr:phosphate transporter PHO1-2-like isoform X2 [Lolium rigidum]